AAVTFSLGPMTGGAEALIRLLAGLDRFRVTRNRVLELPGFGTILLPVDRRKPHHQKREQAKHSAGYPIPEGHRSSPRGSPGVHRANGRTVREPDSRSS